MKPETQHLDFLISQYVGGCLDTASRKSLEQKLVNDPHARKLYKDQHDVQDMLDEWGNRIPLIDWDSFDRQLATRLQHETVGGHGASIFRRWARPFAAAAALFIAASVGYFWHAWNNPAQMIPVAHYPAAVTPAQATDFRIDDRVANHTANFRGVTIDEPAGLRNAASTPALAVITSPSDSSDLNLAKTKGPSSVVAFSNPPAQPADKAATPKDAEPALPYP